MYLSTFSLESACSNTLLLFLLLIGSDVLAQAVQGRVTEDGTGKPVGYASIYFEGSFRGTISDEEGFFRLNTEGIGKQIPLTVSAIGYQSEIIDSYSSKPLEIKLKPKVTQLKEVVIGGSDGMPLKEKLAIFKREFLGTTANARSCKIINEADLIFNYSAKTKTLKAYCDQPLIIDNKSLGYTITYFLESFTYKPSSTSFQGNYYFSQDSSAAGDKNLAKRRERTYWGSRMHFIRSLWDNQLKENKFQIYSASNTPLNYKDLVATEGPDKYFRIPGNLRLSFGNNSSRLIRKKTASFIDAKGYFDPSAVTWAGEMAVQRIADLLPFEYQPSKTQNKSSEPARQLFDNEVQALTARLDSFSKKLPTEKLFIHTDKPHYAIGDTIWFKAYLLDGKQNAGSTHSGLIYMELVTDSLKTVKRLVIPAASGVSWGQIALTDTEFKEGNYTLIAYTNWMRNFGEDGFFKKELFITQKAEDHWLVGKNHQFTDSAGKRNLDLVIQLKNLSNKPINFTELDWKLQSGRRVLAKESTKTLDGKISSQLELPARTEGTLLLTVENRTNRKQKVAIPLTDNDPEKIDMQFMPEGGHLVATLPARVAFKAIGTDGLSVPVSGTITDSKNNVFADFNTSFKGMGSFELIPSRDEVYTANVRLPNGQLKKFKLPAVKPSGTVIRVVNNPKSDSIKVYILLSDDLTNNSTYRVVAFSRGSASYGATFTASKQGASATIAKQAFPTGIVHFSLFNSSDQPLNERLVFIQHDDELQIDHEIQPYYSVRDSVPLLFQVADAEGKPVSATFSVAVTDDSQVKADSLQANLLTETLLKSELQGHIEAPWLYFQKNREAAYYMDLLMLTQGWRGYKWDQILKGPQKPGFLAESEFRVSGRVLNILNKPVAKTNVLLMGMGKTKIFRDTITNDEGRFEFKAFPPLDTAAFFIQARNPRGKSFNVGVVVDAFKPLELSNAGRIMPPWYVNSDSTLLKFVQTNVGVQKKKQDLLLKGGNLLKEVTVNAKKVIKRSKNLNGSGEADQVIDEEAVAEADRTLLTDVLMATVRGFQSRTRKTEMVYFVHDKEARFILDGIDLKWFYQTEEGAEVLGDSYFEFLRGNLNSIAPSEVLGIEVMFNRSRTSNYDMKFLTTEEIMANKEYVYIEITTRSGQGTFAKTTPGTAVYKPLPISWPREFYRPRYHPKRTLSPIPDLRSTIHWEPNLVSDASGKALVSFFSSQNPGTYTVTIQGTDLKGLLGYKTFKIKVVEDKK
ncbi:carboxypeptidase-like regulatory domain-containing protein [Pedobacter sp. SYSU D00535]|uniref:carboxypeptidase-like regulatory domain-containing protein n=1 Tax=Pedobacter sp. SYSU D00535 TaxID=2810308 RepID=UPI001A95F77C|nr:carboxypeptidase-like regulatory domain-containing protein [Pedobacter sp. SYSU D00535]